MTAPEFFIAEDGGGEPTLWLHDDALPLPVVRRCDLNPVVRGEGWAFIEAAVSEVRDVAAHRCGSDGGRGIGAGHVCLCVRVAGHPLDSARPHGCSCGALWACEPCLEADHEGCAACGAAPAWLNCSPTCAPHLRQHCTPECEAAALDRPDNGAQTARAIATTAAIEAGATFGDTP